MYSTITWYRYHVAEIASGVVGELVQTDHAHLEIAHDSDPTIQLLEWCWNRAKPILTIRIHVAVVPVNHEEQASASSPLGP